jgi:HK97 family phage major capsid protein
MQSQTEKRLELRLNERATVQTLHEELLKDAADKDLTDVQKAQASAFRERAVELDSEIAELEATAVRDREADERSRAIRRAAAGANGVEVTEDGIVYRTMAEYARDIMITHGDRHVRAQVDQNLSKEEIGRAADRLQLAERTPATTLTSDLAGLNPAQHIAQIFQVINTDRPLVEAAGVKANLNKGTVTYPQVDATPVVAVQTTQKTEAGNTGMDISMVTKTASTYLGGGNLSWQAIEWSDPNAFDLWFRYAAAHYALMTETDAATVVSASAFLNNIASTVSTSATFAQHMTAVGAGYAEVYANSGRTANALIMAPDRYGFFLGLTSDAFTQFVNVGQQGIGPLRIIVSRGLNAGEIIVGDMDGLLVAETPGAPVRLFVSEPAIAGVEVGLVGAFEAAVVDDGAFALISTAS